MRRDSTIPSVEFEVSAVTKTQTGVSITLVKEKRTLEVPFDSVEDVATYGKKSFVTLFRRDLEALALDERLGFRAKVDAYEEKLIAKPIEAPLVFADVVAAAEPVDGGGVDLAG